MNKYEILYIIQNDVDDEVKNKTIEKYSKLIESLNGTVESIDKWGTKKYAYKINFKSDALLLPFCISYPVENISDINKPSTHTHFIINDVFHNMSHLILPE